MKILLNNLPAEMLAHPLEWVFRTSISLVVILLVFAVWRLNRKLKNISTTLKRKERKLHTIDENVKQINKKVGNFESKFIEYLDLLEKKLRSKGKN